jgi:hypothetical protein
MDREVDGAKAPTSGRARMAAATICMVYRKYFQNTKCVTKQIMEPIARDSFKETNVTKTRIYGHVFQE